MIPATSISEAVVEIFTLQKAPSFYSVIHLMDWERQITQIWIARSQHASTLYAELVITAIDFTYLPRDFNRLYLASSIATDELVIFLFLIGNYSEGIQQDNFWTSIITIKGFAVTINVLSCHGWKPLLYRKQRLFSPWVFHFLPFPTKFWCWSCLSCASENLKACVWCVAFSKL